MTAAPAHPEPERASAPEPERAAVPEAGVVPGPVTSASASANGEQTGAGGAQEAAPQREMPTSQPVLLRALRWGIVASVLLILVFAVIGWLVSGQRGLIGGAMGAAFAGVFLALTVGSITFANRFTGSDLYVPLFFGIVMGSWILKFIAFIVAALLLKNEPWLDPTVLFLAVVAGVLVSLVIDVIIVTKSRIPIMPDPSLKR